MSLLELGLAGATNGGTETLLELVDAAFGVNELVLTGEEGVRVRGDTARDNVVFYTVNNFRLSGGSGGAGHETATGRDVNEDNRIVLGMDIFLHGEM